MAGRRPEKALNAAFVRSVREPGKCVDGHGLYLRVEPNGSRFWVQRIAIRGKRTELGLGSPSLVSLKEAREKALANRKMARDAGAPPQARRAAGARPWAPPRGGPQGGSRKGPCQPQDGPRRRRPAPGAEGRCGRADFR